MKNIAIITIIICLLILIGKMGFSLAPHSSLIKTKSTYILESLSKTTDFDQKIQLLSELNQLIKSIDDPVLKNEVAKELLLQIKITLAQMKKTIPNYEKFINLLLMIETPSLNLKNKLTILHILNNFLHYVGIKENFQSQIENLTKNIFHELSLMPITIDRSFMFKMNILHSLNNLFKDKTFCDDLLNIFLNNEFVAFEGHKNSIMLILENIIEFSTRDPTALEKNLKLFTKYDLLNRTYADNDLKNSFLTFLCNLTESVDLSLDPLLTQNIIKAVDAHLTSDSQEIFWDLGVLIYKNILTRQKEKPNPEILKSLQEIFEKYIATIEKSKILFIELKIALDQIKEPGKNFASPYFPYIFKSLKDKSNALLQKQALFFCIQYLDYLSKEQVAEIEFPPDFPPYLVSLFKYKTAEGKTSEQKIQELTEPLIKYSHEYTMETFFQLPEQEQINILKLNAIHILLILNQTFKFLTNEELMDEIFYIHYFAIFDDAYDVADAGLKFGKNRFKKLSYQTFLAAISHEIGHRILQKKHFYTTGLNADSIHELFADVTSFSLFEIIAKQNPKENQIWKNAIYELMKDLNFYTHAALLAQKKEEHILARGNIYKLIKELDPSKNYFDLRKYLPAEISFKEAEELAKKFKEKGILEISPFDPLFVRFKTPQEIILPLKILPEHANVLYKLQQKGIIQIKLTQKEEKALHFNVTISNGDHIKCRTLDEFKQFCQISLDSLEEIRIFPHIISRIFNKLILFQFHSDADEKANLFTQILFTIQHNIQQKNAIDLKKFIPLEFQTKEMENFISRLIQINFLFPASPANPYLVNIDENAINQIRSLEQLQKAIKVEENQTEKILAKALFEAMQYLRFEHDQNIPWCYLLRQGFPRIIHEPNLTLDDLIAQSVEPLKKDRSLPSIAESTVKAAA